MIRNLRTNHYIKFGSAHFNTLLKKQETEGTKYFLKKDISKLNTAYKKLRQRGGNRSNVNIEDVCPICLDSVGNLTMVKLIPCNHELCTNCLKTICKSGRGSNECRCPLCRQMIEGPVEFVPQEERTWRTRPTLFKFDVRIVPTDSNNTLTLSYETMEEYIQTKRTDIVNSIISKYIEQDVYQIRDVHEITITPSSNNSSNEFKIQFHAYRSDQFDEELFEQIFYNLIDINTGYDKKFHCCDNNRPEWKLMFSLRSVVVGGVRVFDGFDDYGNDQFGEYFGRERDIMYEVN